MSVCLFFLYARPNHWSFVPRLGMGLDGHLGEVIGYNNNNNKNSNDNNDDTITDAYNIEPLSSIYVQTVGPFVPRLGMGLDGHLGEVIGYINNNTNINSNDNDNENITTLYNRKSLSSIYVRTVGPFVPNLAWA